MYPELEKMKRLDPVNLEYLDKYARSLTLQQLRTTSINDKLRRVYAFLIFFEFQDLMTATPKDIEDFLISRKTKPTYRGKPCSDATIQGDLLGIKLFFRFLRPDDETKLFENIKIRRPKHRLPVERLLSRADIEKLVNACDTQRDRAMVMLLWDSGCRINEVLSRNVGNVEFDRYGAVMVVDGKTGQRRIRLTACVGDLQNWINIHPFKDNADAPLFLTYSRYGIGRKRINDHTFSNRLKVLADLAKITKPVHPHAIRHARLTDLAKQGFSEAELRIIAGWEAASGMPSVYVHLSGADVEKKILQKAGLSEPEESQEMKLEAKRCPRCKTINSPGVKYCGTCSLILDAKTAQQVEQAERRVEETPEFQILREKLTAELIKS